MIILTTLRVKAKPRTHNREFGKIRVAVTRVSSFGSLCICISGLTLNI